MWWFESLTREEQELTRHDIIDVLQSERGKQSPSVTDYNIASFCCTLGGFSISLENKPIVPVGYHTPCRSEESWMSEEYSLFTRGLKQVLYSARSKDIKWVHTVCVCLDGRMEELGLLFFFQRSKPFKNLSLEAFTLNQRLGTSGASMNICLCHLFNVYRIVRLNYALFFVIQNLIFDLHFLRLVGGLVILIQCSSVPLQSVCYLRTQ